MRVAVSLAVLLAGTAHADDRTYLHVELDPLTFANAGYGAQLGVRLPPLHGVRLAIASFSLHVPDAIAQLGGNDGFDERVQPSGAVYALYYLRTPGEDGLAVGGSVRLLRVRYRHDDVPDLEDHVTEVSPEAIVGYQWHPFHDGFYVQPWLALGVTVWRDHDARVGDHAFTELPVSPFFTVNLGWEHGL
jgi:hypothetical protein